MTVIINSSDYTRGVTPRPSTEIDPAARAWADAQLAKRRSAQAMPAGDAYDTMHPEQIRAIMLADAVVANKRILAMLVGGYEGPKKPPSDKNIAVSLEKSQKISDELQCNRRSVSRPHFHGRARDYP